MADCYQQPTGTHQFACYQWGIRFGSRYPTLHITTSGSDSVRELRLQDHGRCKRCLNRSDAKPSLRRMVVSFHVGGQDANCEKRKPITMVVHSIILLLGGKHCAHDRLERSLLNELHSVDHNVVCNPDGTRNLQQYYKDVTHAVNTKFFLLPMESQLLIPSSKQRNKGNGPLRFN